ncbi:hypothetical protein SynBIOSU31_01270 [Synechococcus sp. BIOS-U3-1]|uniref:hypothetical protein n=1 Tax=Synechococcus sp. BIOS-U3-1 TaxID=1400865 RepID=UPI001645627B|nr:hypothetical protein [Synechococcus sp. BIOS-U3-1]QNI58149.1 hypothetical protein SynBIOSU31_01270 [Synechococcus sp. BIOS-U3-1]
MKTKSFTYLRDGINEDVKDTKEVKGESPKFGSIMNGKVSGIVIAAAILTGALRMSLIMNRGNAPSSSTQIEFNQPARTASLIIG